MLFPFGSVFPRLARRAFVHPLAAVVGRVSIGADSSVWLHAVIRADLNKINIGAKTNIQDNASLHVSRKAPIKIGDGVSIGHGAIVHGCVIGSNCIIGMGSIVLNRARIGRNCLVAAGAVVTEGMRIPTGSLVMGVPAKVKRKLSKAEIRGLRANACEYVALAASHAGKAAKK
ncbi:MAG TPA: gamma carbonic anhydrase family protein [Candidatus Diapherotrites archaeon]|uniref:Gamma carbonic anhydrase family protein n=1 Tax=Candidatus Iainarchaeum sp. TaxID=3101447 RepID=A0A7J4JEL2_9ARCH|nr:gamma carbonic anhydrase family protein [Candidatus Diapherotrites archaeon]HIH16211.1 gamma carbonic anhydrase family protein [Candidatus Diapherotrites archaeon]